MKHTVIIVLTLCLGLSCNKYKHLKENLYSDKAGNLYLHELIFEKGNVKDKGTSTYRATMPLTAWGAQDSLSNFIDTATYEYVRGGAGGSFYADKNHVYLLFTPEQYHVPVQMRIVENADPETFQAYSDIALARDKRAWYFLENEIKGFLWDSNPGFFRTEVGAGVLNGYYEFEPFYFTDHQNVFYGADKVVGADPETFQLVDGEQFDAKDKNEKYLEGVIMEQ